MFGVGGGGSCDSDEKEGVLLDRRHLLKSERGWRVKRGEGSVRIRAEVVRQTPWKAEQCVEGLLGLRGCDGTQQGTCNCVCEKGTSFIHQLKESTLRASGMPTPRSGQQGSKFIELAIKR